jgi:hypothetical protein
MLNPSQAHSLFMQQHITREAWLLAAVQLLRPLFAAKGFSVPPCQVSCGFASTGTRSGHVGQCWSTKSASNELNQIFIAPIRLHISPTAPGTLRDLLAVSITGTDLQGHGLSQSGAMLQLPAVEQTAFAAMPAEELVERRLLEVEFGKASNELRVLARQGNRAATRRKLEQMEQRFGHHPWLKAKMAQMHRLAEEDMDMMIKEVSYSSMRMSKSLASRSEAMFSVDETESEMPAFLRKKESEGRGRRDPNQI